jgi:hypothetical protein
MRPKAARRPQVRRPALAGLFLVAADIRDLALRRAFAVSQKN